MCILFLHRAFFPHEFSEKITVLTIIDGYDVRQLLPQQLALLQATATQMGG